MNRHARRAAGKNGFAASLDEMSGMTVKLESYINQVEGLKAQLANAAELLNEIRSESAAVTHALNAQQELYFRLFAAGMGVPLETVVSMASEIQAQLNQGVGNGIKTSGTTAPEENAEDPSAGAQDRLATSDASDDRPR